MSPEPSLVDLKAKQVQARAGCSFTSLVSWLLASVTSTFTEWHSPPTSGEASKEYTAYVDQTLVIGRRSPRPASTCCSTAMTSNETVVTTQPQLPPELLRSIFLHATDTHPYPLSIHTSGAGLPDTVLTLDEERRLHHRSMRTKLSISGVCWAWRVVSLEMVYNSIRVASHDTFTGFLGCITTSDEELGRHVRDFWVDGDVDIPWQDVITLCPRLESIRGVRRAHRALLASQTAPSTLVICAQDGLDPFFEMYGRTLRSGALHTLSLTSCDADIDFMHGNFTLDLPSLVDLRLSSTWAVRFAIKSITASSLQKLTCLCPDAHEIPPLITKFGATIHTLSFPLLDLLRFDTAFVAACPNLHSLRIHLLTLPHVAIPPSVTSLGIHGMETMVLYGLQDEALEYVREALASGHVKLVQDCSIDSQVSRDRCIKIWDGSSLSESREHWQFWVELCELVESRSAELVDWRGWTIADEFRREALECSDS